MSGAAASGKIPFAAIQSFQAERCGRPFCAKYGAFGTGIGLRIRQKNEHGTRKKDELCLRVFVLVKSKRPKATRLPPRFKHTFGNKIFNIPVDVCEAERAEQHAVLLPSSEPTFSGFEAGAKMIGTLGGWAWHPPSNSLVLLSCWHVLGDKPVDATGGFYYPRREVARVRSGVRVRGGEHTNQVDCAFADPFGNVVTEFKFLERVPPILASRAPIGSSMNRPSVSRYRPWKKEGTIPGYIDAVSVEMYIPYEGRQCWFTDLFIVRGCEGPFGQKGDSGSLVFGRVPADRSKPLPTLGMYMGAINEGMRGQGQKRTLGIACRMDRVETALGVERVDLQPIFAFLNCLIDSEEPLDFLKLRRSETAPEATTAGGRAEALFAYMRRMGGRALVGPLKRQRRVVVGLLVESDSIRQTAARALRPLLRSEKTPQAILEHVLTEEERKNLIALILLLRGDTRLRMRGALKPYLQAVRNRDRKTFGDVLRFLDQQASQYDDARLTSASAPRLQGFAEAAEPLS